MGLASLVGIEAYLPFLQEPNSSMELVVRTQNDPLEMVNAIRKTVWAIDKTLPVTDIHTMDQALQGLNTQRRFIMLLLSGAAALAMLLTAVGLYALMSYSVTQRTREIAIRMALGAQPREALKLVMGDGMMSALIGVATGLIVSLALTRLISGLLYGVSAMDPITFAAGVLILIGTALSASYIAGRQAMKVTPMAVLKSE